MVTSAWARRLARAGSRLTRCSSCWAVVLLLLFAIVGASSVYNETLTYDEPDHLEFGRLLLEGRLEHASMQRMPITALNAAPLVIARAAGVSLSAKRFVWLVRLPTILAAVLLGYAVFAWSRELYGPRGGLFSLFVFILCPTVIAHSRLATTDVTCALFSFLSVFLFVRYSKSLSWKRLLAAAAVMGVAQLTKQTALLLFPINLALFCLHRLAKRRQKRREQSAVAPVEATRARTVALQALAYVVVVGIVINAGYGFKGSFDTLDAHEKWLASAGVDAGASSTDGRTGHPSVLSRVPIPLPGPYIEAAILGQYYNKTGQGHGQIYLLGSRSQLGWWYYFPVAFALKTPLPTLALIFIALYLSARNRRFTLDSDETALGVSIAGLLVFFVFFCTAQIGVRYLLPVLPFLFTLVGQVAIWKPRRLRRPWNACLIVLSVWLPVSVFSYYPHYLAYFNEVCWNRLLLYRSLADSNLDWGQNGWYLRRYLQAHAGKPIAINPGGQVTGTVIVSVNNLVGLTSAEATYRWLRNEHSPVTHVGYSWVVYEIPASPTR